MAALDAGQAAGGDKRGMQSAAMVIVRRAAGVWLNNDTVLRLQVDDSPEPFKEMRRLVESWNQRRAKGQQAPGEAAVERLTAYGLRRTAVQAQGAPTTSSVEPRVFGQSGEGAAPDAVHLGVIEAAQDQRAAWPHERGDGVARRSAACRR